MELLQYLLAMILGGLLVILFRREAKTKGLAPIPKPASAQNNSSREECKVAQPSNAAAKGALPAAAAAPPICYPAMKPVWRGHRHSNGSYYYHNRVAGLTQWNRPTDAELAKQYLPASSNPEAPTAAAAAGPQPVARQAPHLLRTPGLSETLRHYFEACHQRNKDPAYAHHAPLKALATRAIRLAPRRQGAAQGTGNRG